MKLVTMLYALFVFVTSCVAAGTVYYDRATGKALYYSADASLISTASSRIASAPATFQLEKPEGVKWSAGAVVLMSDSEIRDLYVSDLKRQAWLLQAVRAQAALSATQQDLDDIDRDVELLQRRAAAVVKNAAMSQGK